MQSSDKENDWLTLSEAAAHLKVHPVTLRRWADNGSIRTMVTPGGHRRFALADLVRFTEQSRRLGSMAEAGQAWFTQALVDTRREVQQHQSDNWLTTMNEQAREQNRLLGRRLMGLLLQYLSEPSDSLLDEARNLGRESGQVALGAGIPLAKALEAAIFFRDTLVETALNLPENVRIRPETNRHLMHRLNALLNAVHLAIAEVYHDALSPSMRRPELPDRAC